MHPIQAPNIEPPNGDFVAYLEAIVGPAPSGDPEALARQMAAALMAGEAPSRVLGAGAEAAMPHAWGGAGASPSGSGTTARASTAAPNNVSGTSAAAGQARQDLDGLPDIAGAIGTVASGLGNRLIQSLGGLLIALGIGIVVLATALADTWPALTPGPGVMLAIIGVFLRNFGSTKQKRTSNQAAPIG